MLFESEKIFRGKQFYYCYYKDTSYDCLLHTHNFYEVFLTLSDNFRHNVSGQNYILKKGTLVFIRPSDTHANLFPTSPQSYIQLCFTKDIADSLFSFLGDEFFLLSLLNAPTPPTFTLSPEDSNSLFAEFRKSESIAFDSMIEKSEFFKKLLFKIFTSYLYKYAQKSKQSAPTWLIDAISTIKKKQLYIEGIEASVEVTGKSYKTFYRNLIKYYNQTPAEFILTLRLTQAHNMLTQTFLPITDICYECGFSSISYFYTTFKAHYQETPSQVRKKSELNSGLSI